jgi:hypothetical protein
VKRPVFIVLVVALLLLSQAITLLATRAGTPKAPIRVESIDFYYKMDAKARFLELKNRWQSENRGMLAINKAGEMAKEAYDQSSVESVFDQWRYHGGPAPQVFTGKAHIYNSGKSALLNVPVSVTVRAKVGDLRVDPLIQMTDYDYLKETATWEMVSSETITIPALAPGEDMLLPVMKFRLLEFLAAHPNRWPVLLEVKISSALLGTARKTISLVPDHFVVPVLY